MATLRINDSNIIFKSSNELISQTQHFYVRFFSNSNRCYFKFDPLNVCSRIHFLDLFQFELLESEKAKRQKKKIEFVIICHFDVKLSFYFRVT